MCCIFTCFGWVADLVQRFITFAMSCCIASAVCCSLFVASIAGVALGYNYSLAEYIDLKETNVSVYLKRGVFDDEISDDLDWRRSGHQGPVPNALMADDSNLKTAPPLDENNGLRSGRRQLDSSLLQSDEGHKFEGQLMKLTAAEPAEFHEPTAFSPDEISVRYSKGSINEIKGIQGLINARRSGSQRATTLEEGLHIMSKQNTPSWDGIPDILRVPNTVDPYGSTVTVEGYNYRKAVPGQELFVEGFWRKPKFPEQVSEFDPDLKGIVTFTDDSKFTYPPPRTPELGPPRPNKVRIEQKSRTKLLELLTASSDTSETSMEQFYLPPAMGNRLLPKGGDYGESDNEIKGGILSPARRKMNDEQESKPQINDGVNFKHRAPGMSDNMEPAQSTYSTKNLGWMPSNPVRTPKNGPVRPTRLRAESRVRSRKPTLVSVGRPAHVKEPADERMNMLRDRFGTRGPTVPAKDDDDEEEGNGMDILMNPEEYGDIRIPNVRKRRNTDHDLSLGQKFKNKLVDNIPLFARLFNTFNEKSNNTKSNNKTDLIPAIILDTVEEKYENQLKQNIPALLVFDGNPVTTEQLKLDKNHSKFFDKTGIVESKINHALLDRLPNIFYKLFSASAANNERASNVSKPMFAEASYTFDLHDSIQFLSKWFTSEKIDVVTEQINDIFDKEEKSVSVKEQNKVALLESVPLLAKFFSESKDQENTKLRRFANVVARTDILA